MVRRRRGNRGAGQAVVEIEDGEEYALPAERELVEIEPVFTSGNLERLLERVGRHVESSDQRCAAIERRQLHPFPDAALRDTSAYDLVARQREAYGRRQAVGEDPVGIERRILRAEAIGSGHAVIVERARADAQPRVQLVHAGAGEGHGENVMTRSALPGLNPPTVERIAAYCVPVALSVRSANCAPTAPDSASTMIDSFGAKTCGTSGPAQNVRGEHKAAKTSHGNRLQELDSTVKNVSLAVFCWRGETIWMRCP